MYIKHIKLTDFESTGIRHGARGGGGRVDSTTLTAERVVVGIIAHHIPERGVIDAYNTLDMF